MLIPWFCPVFLCCIYCKIASLLLFLSTTTKNHPQFILITPCVCDAVSFVMVMSVENVKGNWDMRQRDNLKSENFLFHLIFRVSLVLLDCMQQHSKRIKLCLVQWNHWWYFGQCFIFLRPQELYHDDSPRFVCVHLSTHTQTIQGGSKRKVHYWSWR